MTPRELQAAAERMGAAEKEFMRDLLRSPAPTAGQEATLFVEIFHYFPGAHFEDQQDEPVTPKYSGQLGPNDPLPF